MDEHTAMQYGNVDTLRNYIQTKGRDNIFDWCREQASVQDEYARHETRSV